MKTLKLGFVSIAVLWLIMSAGCAGHKASSASVSDMTGKWTLFIESPRGNSTLVMALKQDGSKLSGTFTGQLGEIEVSGGIEDNDWSISFDYDLLGILYKGKVDGDGVSGIFYVGVFNMIPYHMPYFIGTFTGKREI